MKAGYYDNQGIWHEPGEGQFDVPNDFPEESAQPPVQAGAPPVFTAPQDRTSLNLPAVPGLDLPDFKPPPAFEQPSVAKALSDPSYIFRRNQGLDGLQRWAAAKGTLNDTGTANALMDYGQNAASQEYQNIWNRDYNTYQTNYQTQYVDPYQFKYKAAIDQNAPQMEAWKVNAALTQGFNERQYNDAWNQFLEQQREYELTLPH